MFHIKLLTECMYTHTYIYIHMSMYICTYMYICVYNEPMYMCICMFIYRHVWYAYLHGMLYIFIYNICTYVMCNALREYKGVEGKCLLLFFFVLLFHYIEYNALPPPWLVAPPTVPPRNSTPLKRHSCQRICSLIRLGWCS